jgi:AcrR family transcriptional regulator
MIKNSKTTAKKKIAPQVGSLRGPGRPGRLAATTTEISREILIARALELARKEPLQNISMVRLAREFGVTPALIHYYLHGVNSLISGVINLYARLLVESLPHQTGVWRVDLERQITSEYKSMVEYSGVTAYLLVHNRFRLVQEVSSSEVDYSLLRFEMAAKIFRDGGFTPSDAAMNLHLITQFAISSAYAFSLGQLPAEHASFLSDQLSKFTVKQAPGISFIRKAFVRMDAEKVFHRGLELHLEGFQRDLDERPGASRTGSGQGASKH